MASPENGRKFPEIELERVKVLLELLLRDRFLTLYDNSRKILLEPPIELILTPKVPYSSPLQFVFRWLHLKMVGSGLKLS